VQLRLLEFYNIIAKAISFSLHSKSNAEDLYLVFDSLGFFSPVVKLGKIFVQELWLLKHDWDEKLPPSYAKQWQKYREELKLIEQCLLPRSVGPISFGVDT